MKKLLVVLIVLISCPALAQLNVIYVDAYLLDGQTQQPIDFANINIINRDLGTVSEADGTFKLEIIEDQIGPQDQIKLSAVGYAPKVMTMKRLYNLLEANNVVYLNPYNKTISSETVVANNPGSRTKGISGTVVVEGKPIQGAVVRIKGSLQQVKTDYQGNFSIDALSGDVLQVDYLTTLPKEVTAQPNMNIALVADGELLEEVELRARKEREVALGSRNIETAYGTRDFDQLGYAASQITAAQISSSYVTLGQVLNRMVGVQVTDVFGPNPIYTFNRSFGSSISNSTLPIVVVDEMIYEQGPNQVPFVDPQNIYSVTAIPGVVGSVRYGTLGRSGVIIIRTKTYAASQGDYAPEDKKQSALVEGNDYNERLIKYADLKESDYLYRLKLGNSFDAAKAIYEREKALANNADLDFYVESAMYFGKYDAAYASEVAFQILELAPKNTVALKTLAFTLEALGDLEGAKGVYQRLALLAPNEAQSYRDLAYIYKETGEYTKSFALYKRILANNIAGVDFSEIAGVADAEMRHLIANHKSKVYYKDLPNSLLQVDYKKDVRIVFEWTDPTAEFDLQFVNPKGKYYTYKHTRFDNLEAMQNEVKLGYAIEQFEIDEAMAGSWLINAEAFNTQNNNTPVYVKYTVYKNFATPNETKKVGLINLSSLDGKVTVQQVGY